LKPTLIAAGSSAGGGKVIVGLAVAIVSAGLYDLGYILEKQALSGLPPVRPNPAQLARTVAGSRRWIAGFVAMLAGLGLQVVALTLAPVSVVQPVLAAGLVGLVVAGGPVLGERLHWRQRAALLLVIAAVIAIAISSRPGATLARAVPAGRFSVLAVPVVFLALAAAAAGLRVTRRAGGTAPPPWTAAALAGAAGLLYGLGAVAEKAVATDVVGRGIYGGVMESLSSAYPWLFLVVTLAGMVVFQVALQAHPASMVATVSNVVSSVCALAGASIVFGELLLPHGWWSVPRFAGFAGVAGALVLLAWTPADSRVGAAIP
jgi:multidrug transporter EmrE-like cation transporter